LPDEINSEKSIGQLDFPLLLAIQQDLETYFTILDIDYKIQITSINTIPAKNIKLKISELKVLLDNITQKTEKISTLNLSSSYMEFGDILKQSIDYLNSLLSLLNRFYSGQ